VTVNPFVIDIKQALLDDLADRLERARIAPAAQGLTWSAGVSAEYLAGLLHYWRTSYDWRAAEAELNRRNQVLVDVEGTTIHAVHERSQSADAQPVLLLHGWPDSFVRYHRVVPLLSDRYHVVVPSLPGYGFSDPAPVDGRRAADLMAGLMRELGYERFAVAGGDVGAGVASNLARRHPGSVTSLYVTEVGYPTGQEDFSTLSAAETEFANFIQQWWFQEGGYAVLQSTKPYAVAAGLNDSPVALAAWILSFLNTGAHDNDVEATVGGRDALLTMMMIPWLTQTSVTAALGYQLEAAAAWDPSAQPAGMVQTPTALTVYRRDAQFPREWAERSHNVQRYTRMDVGGHLAPMEVPEVYAADLLDWLDHPGAR
jgi:pimeloyl-ACP methyl ester carboxylesterase